jgi:hypothetical protein
MYKYDMTTQHCRRDLNQDKLTRSVGFSSSLHSLLILGFRFAFSFNSISADPRYPRLCNHVAPSAFTKLSHSAIKIACDLFRHTRTSYPFITPTSMSTAHQDGILEGCLDSALSVHPHCPILHNCSLSNTTPAPQTREIPARRPSDVIRDPPLCYEYGCISGCGQ